MMNSKHSSSIRVLGQRSIPPTFLYRSSNQSSDCKENAVIGIPSKGSRISLSDFLNRKLNKSFVSPKSVQGKERPFLAPGSGADTRESVEGKNGSKKSMEAESSCALDLVFEQLKHTRKENLEHIDLNPDGNIESNSMHETEEGCIETSGDGEIGSSRSPQIKDSRKRRKAFEGGHPKQSTQKGLVILGDDPRPTQKRKQTTVISNQEPMPLYNHYANGSGWWDSNMEGVDNDEVGFNEVWEGVGSTTLGGLDWH